MSTKSATTKAKQSFGDRITSLYSKAGVLVILLIMCIILSIATDTFLTSRNLINVVRQIAFYNIIAFGAMCIIITGGIDLSAGSVVGITSVFVAMAAHNNMPWPIYFLIALLVGLVVGGANGFLVSFTRMPPFIATLGTQIIVRGAALLITNGRPVSDLNEGFIFLGSGGLGPIPMPIIFLVIISAVIWYVLNYSKIGRHVYAIGGNEQAAIVSGVNTKLVKVFVYVLAAVLAAFAGMVLTARVASGQPGLGEGFELEAIAGAVIGGVSLSGGAGTVYGVICGTLIIGVLNNGMDLLNISGYWQDIAQGLIIVLAVLLDTLRRRTAKN